MSGASTEGIKTVLIPVTDVGKSKAVYTALLGLSLRRIPPTTSDSMPLANRSAWCRRVVPKA